MSMSVNFFIKRSVSSVTKKHEDGKKHKKRKELCNSAYAKKTGVT